MNETQKKAIKTLLQKAWDEGFGAKMPLAELAKKVGVEPSVLYDTESMSGELWAHGNEWGDGLIEISENGHGLWMGINFDMKELAEAWSQ